VNETIVPLRDVFEVDPKEVSVRLDSGMDAYQSAQDARREIEKESRALRWTWVRQAVSEKSQEVMNLNVVDVLVGAWKKSMQITQYADTEKYGGGEKILVPLASHTVNSKHQPYVQILLKEREVARVKFDLDFSMTLEGFELEIQEARIRRITTGSGKGEGALSLGEVSLWKRELGPIRFPGSISLGDGIPLRQL
jgi:hypothetical protein